MESFDSCLKCLPYQTANTCHKGNQWKHIRSVWSYGTYNIIGHEYIIPICLFEPEMGSKIAQVS